MTDETVAYMGWGISAQEQIDGLRREVRELRDENAKLRELCKELAEFLTEAEWLQWPELKAEMQRLGVEVDS